VNATRGQPLAESDWQRSTAVMPLLGAALLVSAIAERVHHELARGSDHEGEHRTLLADRHLGSSSNRPTVDR
jgi:hypothetical protein